MYFQEKNAVIALDLYTREQDKTVLPSSFGFSNSNNLNLILFYSLITVPYFGVNPNTFLCLPSYENHIESVLYIF